MKPTFALDLTREAIALLHRTPKGWLSIGEVAFDAPDMAEALDYLRKTALGLSPMGFATKIILPNSQILYTEVEAPGPSRNDKRRQIAAALEGRTPYPVEDLVFDWSGKGATVKVAVVARETLDEAEAFAVQHRLNPVSFVGIPEGGTFVGEPWFGQTVAADTILAPGEGVDRDREAVTILHRDLPGTASEAPAADLPAAEAQADAEGDVAGIEPPAAAESLDHEPLPGLEEALNADLPEAPEAEPAAEAPADAATATPSPEAESEPARTAPEDDLPEALLQALAQEDAPATATPASDTPGTDAPAAEAPARTLPRAEAEVEEAPFAHVTDTAAFPEPDEIPAMPAGLKSRSGNTDLPEDDIPPAPPSAAMVAFSSRRAGGNATSPAVGAAPRPATGPATGPLPPSAPGARLGQPVPRPAGAKGFPGLVTAPSIPGTRAKPKGKPGGQDAATMAATAPTTIKSPARPGGTFGTAAPAKSRTGVVFMVLVALLLIFLALIAAWSSFYLTRNNAPVSDPALASLDVTPDIDDEMLADLQDPAELGAPQSETAPAADIAADAGALATETLPVNIGGEEEVAGTAGAELPEVTAEPEAVAEPEALAATAPEPAPEPLAADAPEPAPATAVRTDLSAAEAPVEDQDEIFLSAMDAPPPALDALALPAPAVMADATPDRPMPPPAFGTVYQFGPDGLLKPTPGGILSPEGVMLIAGKPPRLPPSRSEAAAAAALAAAPEPLPDLAPDLVPGPENAADAPTGGTASPADASLVTAGGAQAVEPVPSDPAMAGFRPRARPEGLVPATDDDAALATEPASDYAGPRPLPRPQIVLAAASATRPAGDPADLGAQAASLTAQAEAQLAAAAALEAQNPSIVAISKRPQGRPRDLSRAVEAAVAAAVREPEPKPEVVAAAAPAAAPAPALKPEELDEIDEPDVAVAAPKIPTKANVAKQATYTKAINLSKLNLIGTYGTDSRRTALIRQSNGRYKKVKVGDKIDGGTIQAITETEVRYQKGGKLLSLKMPKT